MNYYIYFDQQQLIVELRFADELNIIIAIFILKEKIHSIIDYESKASILDKDNNLLLTGRSRLFVAPTTVQYGAVIIIEDYHNLVFYGISINIYQIGKHCSRHLPFTV
jgi:hypothetical protein